MVVLKNGKQLSFAEISALPKAEKDDVLNQLKRSERSAINEYELQVANQGNQAKLVVAQEVNQKGKEIDKSIQEGNQSNQAKLVVAQEVNQI